METTAIRMATAVAIDGLTICTARLAGVTGIEVEVDVAAAAVVAAAPPHICRMERCSLCWPLPAWRSTFSTRPSQQLPVLDDDDDLCPEPSRQMAICSMALQMV